MRTPRRVDPSLRVSALACTVAVWLLTASAPRVAAQCDNPVHCENQLTGNPASEWDIAGAGDASIQGYATDISVDQGGTVEFKITTDATDYRIDIYRLGYYGGDGARLVATVEPSAALPQAQPACDFDATTNLLDCGVWAISASWSVPVDAVSGVYIAKLVREDPEDGRASHIVFVVRDDDGGSDILVQTDDTTWQAYNQWSESGATAGNSLYTGPGGKADKVSYNRPFGSRASNPEDWVFNATYPLIRWLERNGYDVSYCTGVDTDRSGAEILEHDVFVSVGHDEYWSRAQRDNVEAGRDAGVDLAFLSGNEVYWKVRWEESIDGAATPYRTMVCYKEGSLGENQCGTKCDPVADVWTGLWRSGCSFTPPADGCEPENALTGQVSWQGSTHSMDVPALYRNLPFWRDTAIATLLPGQTATLPAGVLGYEWDWEQATYQDSYPAHRMRLSTSVRDGLTHHLSLYRAPSNALVFGAGTVQWSWGLDGVHDRGGSPEDARMQQATVNLLADMGAQPASIQAGLVAATPIVDPDPPTSAITFPTGGAMVEAGTPVTVTGTASDVGASAVGLVEVSFDGGTTWFPATGLEDWAYDWTPGGLGSVTILSRAMDGSFNLETPGAGVTVDVEARECPCSIWADTTIPPVQTDANAIEVGVKVQTDLPGYFTALRFYKGAANTGTHIGHLWLTDGTLLATQTFVAESASGWQEVTLDNPVAVSAGTTYIASYHTTTGNYAFTANGFATAVDNPPLHALADGDDGPNGVYLYSAVPGFPTQTFNASNYWVDVVFSETATDETPPAIAARTPSPGASGVAIGTAVTATFDEPVNDATITFELRDPSTALVAATLSYDAPTRTATLTPDAVLAHNTAYDVTVSDVEDLSGNVMPAPDAWAFTTGGPPPPPPDEGPGGPILVIADAGNPFGRYFAEILRCEGFNAFTVTDISLVTTPVLDTYDVVILGDMGARGLTGGEVTMFSDWVTAGGNLIAMRPDAQLAGLLGLTVAGGTLGEGYIAVDTANPPGTGIVGETIQYHGTADLYTLNGATEVATLYSDATTATANPAVTLVGVGGSGGQAAAFTYDLARSIVYTRQGNPAWAGQERDGTTPIRSDDLFFGNAAGDPQPDWVNLDKVAIPQADEQQRLLANLIIEMNRDVMPLPRFWYLPGRAGTESAPEGFEAAVIMTGDQHGCCASTVSRFDLYLAQSPPGCSLDDWECVRASSYIYTSTDIDDATALSYHNQGFELGVHLNTGCADWTESSLDASFTSQLAAFAAQFPSLPVQDSQRTHCIVWSDWVTKATTELQHGIRLDVDYYFWPGSWVQNRPGMFTGSGMPMRFADLDGTMIDVYQAPSQMTDESGQDLPFTIDALLSAATGPEHYYGAFCANMHTDQANHAGSNAIVASAQSYGVPVVSGRQMLAWLDGRNASAFSAMQWNANVFAFDVTGGTGSRNLQGLLPTVSTVGTLMGLTRDGGPIAYTTETIKGVEYARFFAPDGSYEATYDVDAIAPVITNVLATPDGGGNVLITWDTDEAADSRVDYGTDPGLIDQSETILGLVTSHAVPLSGLPANTTIYYRVTSQDASANAATEPEPPSAPLSFTTPPPVCAADDLSADFALGTPGAGTYVAETDDGEVILAPLAGSEFTGTTLPAGWGDFPWTAGGGATVGGGEIDIDGSRVNLLGAGLTAGHTMEFVATFRANRLQHGGFGAGNDNAPGEIYNTFPWAMFSTGSGGTTLQARTNLGGVQTNTTVGAGFLGSPHLYRIEWDVSEVRFYVDDALVATHADAIATAMRPAISDFDLGGLTFSVDWVRVTDYAASGSFTSRVIDSGAVSDWNAMVWTDDVPGGTTLDVFVRTGGTAVPDGGWTAFAQIPSSGSSVGATARYLQYRVDLTTTDPTITPALEDIAVSCDLGTDTDPPVITNVVATPGEGGTASITWDTDEAADSRVDYGTDPGTLDQSETLAALVLAHDVQLSGLPSSTTIYYRVTSVDASANSATEPVPPGAPLSFVTADVPCVATTTSAEFGAGSTGAATYIAETNDGEVILAPTEGSEFGGVALPVGWSFAEWAVGGSHNVAAGAVSVDGGRVRTDLAYGPGVAVEFVATFGAAANQHIGLSDDFNSSWAIFSTQSSTTNLYYRTNPGGTDVDLGSGPGGNPYIGSPHTYRIEWTSGAVDFFIDGVQVNGAPVPISAGVPNLQPIVSDFLVGGASLSCDWLRMSPYAAAGTYASEVFDAGATAAWGEISWISTEPAGTGVAISVRTGDTIVPDGTWTAYTPIASSGSIVGGSSQYIQYRAELTTGDTGTTPALEELTILCAPGVDTTPPIITNVVATPDPGGTTATITWDTNEPADSAVNYGTDPGTLGSSETDAAFVTSHSIPLTGLTPGDTIHYRVSSVDPSANGATEPEPPASPLSFMTPLPACFIDTATADFEAGTPDANIYVAETGDGEVALAPTVGEEFYGAAVPVDWYVHDWSGGGTASVAGGEATVDGTRINPLGAGFAAGRTLEFRATFATAPYQHVGFGGGADAPPSEMFNTSPWAMFSTGSAGTALLARSWDGGAFLDFTIPGSFLDAPHTYRIDWGATSVDFSIDGTLVHTETVTIAGPMRPGISDLNAGGAVLTCDWIRMTPYATSGTFLSRVYDQGAVTGWDAVSWTSTEPAGTAIAMSVRTGDTPVPDGSWTAFTPVAQGASVGVASQYIQYSADLTTSDDTATPLLEGVSILCGACDSVAPAALADLTSTQVRMGNDTDGTTEITLGWTAPPEPDVATIEVYRKGYGDYPTYASGTEPGVPADPAAALVAGWSLVASLDATTAPVSLTDEPAARDFWYYVTYVVDACNNVSGASALATDTRRGAPGSLNYHLGDVTDGVVAGDGDNLVDGLDVSILGANYALSGPDVTPVAYLDIGPTTTGSVHARPTPDAVIDFDDLILFAINFGTVGTEPLARPMLVKEKPVGEPSHARGRVAPQVELVATRVDADLLRADVRVTGDSGVLKGFHVVVEYLDAEVDALEWGELVAETDAFVFARELTGDGSLTLDAAIFGTETFATGGTLARVYLAAGEDARVRLALVELRDAENRRLGDPGTMDEGDWLVTPARYELIGARPNPFNPTTRIVFRLPETARVRLRIFDLGGRMIRALADGAFPVGEHALVWDGRTDAGARVGSGVYFYSFQAGEIDATEKLVLLK